MPFSAPAAAPTPPIRVLLVEDDPADAGLAERAFRSVGAAVAKPVLRAASLEQALTQVKEVGCDAVLLDLGLPDSQGLDTLRAVLDAAPAAAVVVLTGHDDPDFAERAIQNGAQDYLTKDQLDGAALTRALLRATTRKRLEERARLGDRRMRNILEMAQDAVIVIAANQTMVWVNPAAERLFGWPTDQMVGRDLDMLLPMQERADHHGRVTATFQSEEQTRRIAKGRELTALRSDGAELTVEVMVSRTPTLEGVLFTAVVRDVSERRRAADALRAAKEAAENALMELGQAQARLVQAEKLSALGQMATGFAQEIGSPLLDALAAVSVMEAENFSFRLSQESRATIDPELSGHLDRMEESVQTILANLQRTDHLVRRFKQMAPEKGYTKCCRFSLRHLLADFAADAATALATRGCALVVECPEDSDMDSHPVALTQTLSQLVYNAAQHAYPTPLEADAPLRPIIVKAMTLGDGKRRIEVIDNGVGMTAESRARAFEPFFSTVREDGRAGLGLHAAFNLTTSVLGGDIYLRSAENGGGENDGGENVGTCVVIDLPRIAPT